MVKGRSESFLSRCDAEALRIVSFCSEVFSVRQEMPFIARRFRPDEFKSRFPGAFSGKRGCIKGHQVRLEVDPTVAPVKQRLRPIAILLSEAVS